MRLRGVPELTDEWVAIECLLHHAPLDTLAPAVNESDLSQALTVGLGHVFLDHRFHVFGRKSVQIDLRLDGNSSGSQGAT